MTESDEYLQLAVYLKKAAGLSAGVSMLKNLLRGCVFMRSRDGCMEHNA